MLEAAEVVFAEHGFAAATMDEIADRVGVTKPLIYDYFGSKEGLLAATVEHIRRQLVDTLVTAWRVDAPADPRERLRAVFVAFFDFVVAREQGFAVIRGEGALTGEGAESVEKLRRATARALAAGMSTVGHHDPDDLVLMTEVVIGGAERLAVQRLVHPEMSSTSAADIVLRTVWDGLGAAVTR